MILKGKEARKLFCPWCYPAQDGECSIKCEAEKCMAWKIFDQSFGCKDKDENMGYCQMIEKHGFRI